MRPVHEGYGIFLIRSVAFATVLVAMGETSITIGSEASMNAPQATLRPKATEATIATLSSELSRRFGDRVATSAAVREQHGHTLTWV